ncbi:precorrin-6A/cobalt-precorrin-6A reductase [Egbenema bharatensis]|uniref:precorrin-6A/cobalt-precorrin-6A reductase n=1 Tax=Egbenema bharatensis TaxID=3463334 RepID=UPI003A8AD90D
MTLWLIGGTQESVALARALIPHQIPCLVTVTTDTARSLYPIAPTLQIWVGSLNPATIQSFIHEQSIHCILDASHPFAVEISQLAITTAQRHQIPYLRYERPEIQPSEPSNPSRSADAHGGSPLPTPDSRSADAHGESPLPTPHDLTGHRVLLTLGYRFLHHFQPWHDRATLFARILPSTTALEAALAAGFTPDRLIALRPPISAPLEKALWQQWQISTVITKASGTAGGEDIKRQVAQDLGIRLIVIDRPAITYPQQTSRIATAVDFCLQNFPPARDSTP